jgi:hypothetical protein
MPSLRTFPQPPGLGIARSRTGSGRNVPALIALRRSSRNPDTPMRSSTQAAVRPSTPGGSHRGCLDPVERHDQRRRVVHEVEQVVEPAAGVGHRPTVKRGLHLRYPLAWPCGRLRRSAGVHRRAFRSCSILISSIPLPPFPMCRALPGSEYYDGSAPPSGRSIDDGPSPSHHAGREGKADQGRFGDARPDSRSEQRRAATSRGLAPAGTSPIRAADAGRARPVGPGRPASAGQAGLREPRDGSCRGRTSFDQIVSSRSI